MQRTVMIALTLTALLAGCKKDNDRPVLVVIPPDAAVAGHTYDEIAEMWWEWSLDIPNDVNPLNGGDCTQNQSGDVWFLTGISDGGDQEQTCTIPYGKTLVFPLLNVVYYSCPEVWGVAEDCPYADATGLEAAAAEFGNIAVELEVELNGRAYDGDLTAFYFTSDAFPFEYTGSGPSWLWYAMDSQGAGRPPEDTECLAPWEAGNACGAPEGPRLIIGTGYYVAVEPPEPGHHTIRFAGILNPDHPYFEIDVTYEVTITED